MDGVRLMAMEAQATPEVASVLLDAEDLLGFGVQGPLFDELLRGSARFEARVQLDPRVGPQRAPLDGFVHGLGNAVVAYVDEVAGEGGVIADDLSMESEDIQS